MVLRRIRARLTQSFDPELDSPMIVLLQGLMYFWMMLGGCYLLAFTEVPIQAIEAALGPIAQDAWKAQTVAGPVVWYAARMIRRLRPEAAMYGELVGDGMIVGVLMTYSASIIWDSSWGRGLFGVFIAIGIANCLFLLVVRDAVRIAVFRRRLRR
jgi:hypothetical protein